MTYPDSILFKVSKPARYTGGEWNSIKKDWQAADFRIAVSYPDVYEIGMSNMALAIVYDILNRQPGVLAERVFTSWTDMAAAIKEAGSSLLSLESGHPLGEFDVVGFSLGYELTYSNVLNMLHLASIPLLASQRDDSHPLVIAGGSCSLNPEPMSDFIDMFIVGEAEELLPELVNCLRDSKKQNLSRTETLRRAAAFPGIYVPSFYDVSYNADGSVKSVTPNTKEASATIKRQILTKLPPPVTSPVVPFIEAVHDRGAIEISRGCSRGCRFCNAGVIYRPVRQRPPDEILQAVDELIENCGYDEISLVSLSTSDYDGIERLVAEINSRYKQQNLAVSLPSLRISRDSVNLIDSLSSRRRSGLTFAPEAGSQRLQKVINKCIPEEELMATAAAAFEKGWKSLKLYFMLGLPTETDKDVEGIAQLVNNIQSVGSRVSGKKPQIRLSVSTFVPKPHTPFQWTAMENQQQIAARQEILRNGLRRKGIKLSWSEPQTSLLEAVFSRGDRRLGAVIHRAWQLGASFDGWSEHFNFAIWQQALDECGLQADFYAHRQRGLDEVLPWSHIDIGVSTDFLKREYQRAIKGKETADCHDHACNACGLEKTNNLCINKQKREQNER